MTLYDYKHLVSRCVLETKIIPRINNRHRVMFLEIVIVICEKNNTDHSIWYTIHGEIKLFEGLV